MSAQITLFTDYLSVIDNIYRLLISKFIEGYIGLHEIKNSVESF
jgi:hypothetical protein